LRDVATNLRPNVSTSSSDDRDQKPMLIELADYWTKLADKAERGEKLDGEISLAPIAEQLKSSR
jgi:hypothetical protein